MLRFWLCRYEHVKYLKINIHKWYLVTSENIMGTRISGISIDLCPMTWPLSPRNIIFATVLQGQGGQAFFLTPQRLKEKRGGKLCPEMVSTLGSTQCPEERVFTGKVTPS